MDFDKPKPEQSGLPVKKLILLYNPEASQDHQYPFLQTLLKAYSSNLEYFSEHHLLSDDVAGFHKITRISTRCIPLRFAFYPFFKPLSVLSNNRNSWFLIADELFSLTMIHAMLAKIFTRSRVAVYIFENRKYFWYEIIFARFFSLFVDRILTATEQAEKVIKDIGITKTTKIVPHPVREPFQEVKNRTITRIGFIGRLTASKGLDLFLDAAVRFPDLTFVCYGDGPMKEGLRKAGVVCEGSFRAGELDHVFNGIDLLVLPSVTTKEWREQYGRVLVEAMARGVFIIGSRSGAIPSIIGNEVWTFDEGDIDSFSRCLKMFLNLTVEEAFEIKKSLMIRYQSKFSQDVIADLFQKEFV